MRRLASAAVVAVLLASVPGAQQPAPPRLPLGTSVFESYVELLRQQSGIPGLSGALVQDGVIVWERGLGFADQEARIPATPSTPYLAADLTQMFSAVLLLQCVEQRRLTLDEPLRAPGLSLTDSDATLRQVLSHRAAPAQGGAFQYDPARFAQLAAVMESCAPQPFRKSIAHRLLERLAMIDSVPGHDLRLARAVPDGLFAEPALERYAQVLQRLAQPYRVDRRARATRNDVMPDGINAATGLVSTVRDLARFDAALDAHVLLLEDTQTAAWTPAQLPDGTVAPTGLGWFVQFYRGTRIVWHFGYVPNAYSALYVKIPSRRATMILLANSDGLVVPSLYESGDLTRSLYATVFLRMLL